MQAQDMRAHHVVTRHEVVYAKGMHALPGVSRRDVPTRGCPTTTPPGSAFSLPLWHSLFCLFILRYVSRPPIFPVTQKKLYTARKIETHESFVLSGTRRIRITGNSCPLEVFCGAFVCAHP
eukprot:GEMP01126640.1.p2 GENE.GEMP01126640.1~~GEMP01126640.1.p2  ORF type:complete len:121 (+),score=17.93 GEMP01126640.1:152-514(+)